jgi:hypothetical protein
MRLAVFSESPADEAAICILTDGLLGRSTERADLPALRTRGWPSVRQLLPAVMMNLHYGFRADALVLVVDSDLSLVHLPAHDEASPPESCRLCQLRRVVREAFVKLRPVPNRVPLRVAVGLAMPSLEAWLRCGHDAGATEAAWIVALQSRKVPYDVRRLKAAVYGTHRPDLPLETRRMAEEAARLAGDLVALETWFPNGFGPFAGEVRAWAEGT